MKNKVYWFTGYSGSGKTTIAEWVRDIINAKCVVLDGDQCRDTISRGLGFSQDDRLENITRIAQTAKLLLGQCEMVIVACISPLQHQRDVAYDIIGRDDVVEVFVDTNIAECQARDPKGLYARLGDQMTGLGSPYEKPLNPDLILQTHGKDPLRNAWEVVTDFTDRCMKSDFPS